MAQNRHGDYDVVLAKPHASDTRRSAATEHADIGDTETNTLAAARRQQNIITICTRTHID